MMCLDERVVDPDRCVWRPTDTVAADRQRCPRLAGRSPEHGELDGSGITAGQPVGGRRRVDRRIGCGHLRTVAECVDAHEPLMGRESDSIDIQAAEIQVAEVSATDASATFGHHPERPTEIGHRIRWCVGMDTSSPPGGVDDVERRNGRRGHDTPWVVRPVARNPGEPATGDSRKRYLELVL